MNDWDNDNNRPDDDASNDDMEFDWMADDADDDAPDDTDDLRFDWESDDESDTGDGERTGVTGQLEWQQAADEAPDADDDGEPPAWQAEQPARASRRIEQQMQEAEDADFGDTDALLDWMRDPDDEDDDSADDDDYDEPSFADEVDEDDDMAWMAEFGDDDDDAFVDDDDELETTFDALLGKSSSAADEDTDYLDKLTTSSLGADADDDTGFLDELTTGGLDDDDDTGYLDELTTGGLDDADDDTDYLDELTTGGLDDADDDTAWLDNFADDDADDSDLSAGMSGLDEWADTFADEPEETETDDTAAEADIPDWLAGMEMPEADDTDDSPDDALDATPDAAASPAPEPEVPDWLADVEASIEGEDDESLPADSEEFEAMFAADADAPDAPAPADDSGADDFDSLFDDMEFDDRDAIDEREAAPAAEADWLSEADVPPDDDEPGDLTDAFEAMFGDDDEATDETEAVADDDEFSWFADEETDDDFDPAWLDNLAADDDVDVDELSGAEIDALADELLASDEVDDADLDALLAEIDAVEGDGTDDDTGDLNDLLAEMEAAGTVAAEEDESFAFDDMDEDDDEVFAAFEDEEDIDLDALMAEIEAEEESDIATDDDDFERSFDPQRDATEAIPQEAFDEAMAEASNDDAEDDADDDDFDALFGDLDESDDVTTDDFFTETDNLEEDELDALFASFDEEADFDDDEELGVASAADLDAIFAEMDRATEDETPAPAGRRIPQNEGEIPDWLREVAEEEDEVTAAALVRQRKDRPLDELDDRLLDLRDRGLSLSSTSQEDTQSQERIRAVVPNVKEPLAPPKVARRESQLTAEATFSDTEQVDAELLRSIAGDATADETSARPRRSLLRRIPFVRVLIAALLLMTLAAPFALNLQYGTPPPIEFAAGSPQSNMFFRVNTLPVGARVLLAAEYGPTGARELDATTRSLMEHMLVLGAEPVILSSNAVGLLRAEALAADLAGSDARNQSYYVTRYLPGEGMGIREIATAPRSVFAVDSQGAETGLGITSLDDFALIVVVAERGETVRQWMEQINPVTDTPLLLAVSQAARPQAAPYLDADDVAGYLVGYDDAVTYNAMAIAFHGAPTEPPPPTATPLPATDAPAADADDEATTAPVESDAEATAAITAEATAADTATPAPTDTPTTAPTATPTPTEVPLVQVADVLEDANVRAGSGTQFAIVQSVDPGDRFRVLGQQAGGDFDWINIDLGNGREGWIADFLVDLNEVPETELESDTDTGETGDDGAYQQKQRRAFAKAPPRDVRQGDAERTIQVARNVAGIVIPVYSEANTESDTIAELEPNAEALFLGEEGNFTQVLLDTQQEGWIETRLIRVEDRAASEVDFAPTATPTPTITPTSTVTPTPTFAPVVTPAPLSEQPSLGGATDARSTAQTLGILAAILAIGLGNVYWVLRWLLRERN